MHFKSGQGDISAYEINFFLLASFADYL